MKLYVTTSLYSYASSPSILLPSTVVANEYFFPVILGVYAGLAWVRTLVDLRRPSSAFTTVALTGFTADTAGGSLLMTNGGSSLLSLVGAKSRSTACSVSAGVVGACSNSCCTGSTPGISKSPPVSSVCTPGSSSSPTGG